MKSEIVRQYFVKTLDGQTIELGVKDAPPCWGIEIRIGYVSAAGLISDFRPPKNIVYVTRAFLEQYGQLPQVDTAATLPAEKVETIESLVVRLFQLLQEQDGTTL